MVWTFTRNLKWTKNYYMCPYSNSLHRRSDYFSVKVLENFKCWCQSRRFALLIDFFRKWYIALHPWTRATLFLIDVMCGCIVSCGVCTRHGGSNNREIVHAVNRIDTSTWCLSFLVKLGCDVYNNNNGWNSMPDVWSSAKSPVSPTLAKARSICTCGRREQDSTALSFQYKKMWKMYLGKCLNLFMSNWIFHCV